MKMQSIERLALIILAVILAVWATVLMLRRGSPQQPDLALLRPDTIIITDTVFVKESKTKSVRKDSARRHRQETTPPPSPLERSVDDL